MPLEPFQAEFINVDPSSFSQRLKGKTLVLTGGRSGIGFEIAKTFLEAGANVVIGDLSPSDEGSDEADWFANGGHKDRLEWFTPCNVTKFDDQKGLFARAVERFKEIHFVSANAGIADQSQFFTDDLTPPKTLVLDINLTAVAYTTKLALYYLKRNSAGGGLVVLTSSGASFHATSGLPLYAAAKAGVIGMMRSLAITSQVTSAGIGVAAIVPAFTLTQLLSAKRYKMSDKEADSDPVLSMIKAGQMKAQLPNKVAEGVAHLCTLDPKEANGYALYIQQGKYVNYEPGYLATAPQWMGEEVYEARRTAYGSDYSIVAKALS